MVDPLVGGHAEALLVGGDCVVGADAAAAANVFALFSEHPVPPRPRTTIRKLEHRGVADFDEQLWPINVAILILAGCAVGVISATSDFAAHQWYANGWVHLGVVAVLLVVLVWSIVHLENRTLRRVQLCILLSLILHLGLAFLLHERDMVFVAVRDDERAREAAEEPPPLTVPDYQWTPLEQTEPVEEPFAVPVETQTPGAEHERTAGAASLAARGGPRGPAA